MGSRFYMNAQRLVEPIFNSISRTVYNFYNYRFFPSWTEQQRKITLVFAATIACMTICYAVSRCLFKARDQREISYQKRNVASGHFHDFASFTL